MRNTILLVLLTFITTTSFAQKKSEIKGNRNVTEVTKEISTAFSAIEIDDSLEVILQQGERNEYFLKTDENLQDVIQFKVENGVLRVFSTKRITRSKDLEIKISVLTLTKITLKNDAEVKGENRFEASSFEIIAYNSCKIDIEVETTDFKMMMQHNASGDLDIRAENATITVDDRTDVKMNLQIDTLIVNADKDAELNLDGNTDTATLTLKGSSEVEANDLKISEINLSLFDRADAYVFTNKKLILQSEKNSTTYLYGNPEIVINKFTDNSRLIKK